jgi:hypothetical protein
MAGLDFILNLASRAGFHFGTARNASSKVSD